MCGPSILFVDDEPLVGRMIRKKLDGQFEVTSVCSGAEAIELLMDDRQFPVIVSDMEMPEMNGIEFIEKARKCSPNSIFMMLTANREQDTAKEAVNEGQVFRFLTKPVSEEHLADAVALAFQKQQAETAEKELLNKTFLSSVQILVDALEESSPAAFERTHEIESLSVAIAQAAGLEPDWQLKIAAKLVMVGVALQPDSEKITEMLTRPITTSSIEHLARCSKTTERLVGRIPRLENVASILGQHMDSQNAVSRGAFEDETANSTEKSAGVLKSAVLWEAIKSRQESTAKSLSELKQIMPCLSSAVIQVLADSDTPVDMDGVEWCEVGGLKPGMTLAKDVVVAGDIRLLRKGRELNESTIDKLSRHLSGAGTRVAVVAVD